ncbi:MAG: hypothetical protein GY930_18865 [bacterium]|nr:hypothetical protein [bacterium]
MLKQLFAIILTLVFGSVFLFTALNRETAEIDIRIRPKRTPVGKLFQHFPPGQLFICDFDDLKRLDALMVRQGPAATGGVSLELRRIVEGRGDFLEQPVLRQVTWNPPAEAKGQQWATFIFETVPKSKGSMFHLALRPADGAALCNWAPWSTMRATQGEFRPWGNTVQSDPGTLDFQPLHNDLQTIAIGVNGLDAAAGECRMDIFQLPQDPESKDEPVLVRQGSLGHAAPTASGYAFFSFNPIVDSRRKRYQLKLTLAPGARILTLKDKPRPTNGQTQEFYADGPTAVFYHGVDDAPSALVGQTIQHSVFKDRDLIFRAFGEDGVRSNWIKAKSRGAGKRFIVGLAFWALAMGLALRLTWRSQQA